MGPPPQNPATRSANRGYPACAATGLHGRGLRGVRAPRTPPSPSEAREARPERAAGATWCGGGGSAGQTVSRPKVGMDPTQLTLLVHDL